MMLNKTFYLLLLSLIPLLGFSQANSQYPDSGNKIRLGFQTSGDGLIWRDTQPKVAGYQPINNKAAWIVLDTVNNKFYHYKQSNNTWNLAGQDIDTANLIATKYNLGFKLSLADTQNMLTPYWRSGRFSGTLPVANGGTNASTFTEGSVVFAGTSGTYTQDNSGLFFNNTNNRLGINTASPLGLLEARSTVGGTNNGLFSLYENSGTSPYFTFQKARGTVASPSNVQLNDGMGDLTFSGYAYSDFNAAVVLRAYNYLAPGAAYLNGGFKILINSQANGGLVEYLNIISNGNTAIGDNLTPTERLHVGGNARITGSVTATRFNANTTESGISSQYGSTNATNSYVSYIYNNSNIAYLGNGTSLFSGVNATDFGITTAISSNLIFGTNNLERMSILSGGAIRFKGINTTANLNALFENSSSALNFFSTEGSGTTKDIGFYNSGSGGLGVIILKANGNVGIGTTNPNQKLTLGSSDGTQALSFVTSTYLGDNVLIGNIEFSTNGADASYGNLANIKAYKTGTNTNSGDLTFWTKSSGAYSEKLRIKHDGNVGIGTASPTFKLDVAGTGRFTGSITSTAVNSIISTGGSSILSSQYTGTNGNWFTFQNAGGVHYVGIDNSAGTDFGATAYSMLFYTPSTRNIEFLSPAGKRMTIASGGAVTINNLGTGPVYSNSGVLSNTPPSDERLKNNITNISWGLNDILKLRPVSFNWKDDRANQGKQFGFIAQEVHSIMPEAIKIFGEDFKYLGLEKDAIYATLVKAVQELSAEIDILKQEIINLKNK